MKRNGIAAHCALIAALVWPAATARADGYRLDRFRGAERADDGFSVKRLSEQEHLQLGANATLDYGNDPLLAIVKSGGNVVDRTELVSNEMVLKVDLSLALWSRLLVLASFDAPVWMEGETPPARLSALAADGAGFGDVSLGARVLLAGGANDMGALGVQGVLVLPTASGKNYSGEPGPAFRPELLLQIRPHDILRVVGNVGTVLKSGKAELVYAISAGVPVHERFELMGELHGGIFDPQPPGSGSDSSLEWLLGAKANDTSGLYFGAAGGTRIASSIGTPDFRVIAQLGWITPIDEKPPVVAAPVDTDADGIPDDRDGCPTEAEDPDGFQDEDGCPDLDNDADGISDAQDKCPLDAEDKDGFEDEDGCPDLDNDSDGVPDTNDKCPAAAEDTDGFEDEDGCPDLDNDGDGIPDTEDDCPNEPGEASAKGCKPRVQVSEQGEITIDGMVLFAPNEAEVLASGEGVLGAVRDTLEKGEEIKTVRIEGHTDSSGRASLNARLSRDRALSVGLWLIEHGIDPARLTAYGCSFNHPVADNDTEEGRAKNRRVVFQITDPVPSEAGRVRRPKGCRSVKLKAKKQKKAPKAKKPKDDDEAEAPKGKKKEKNGDAKKPEEPKDDAVSTEKAGKAETAQPEAAKPEAPKAEAPKPEAPKPEAPKPEAPKPPKPEAPKAEAPKAQAPNPPKPEARKAEAPKAEAPKPPTAPDKPAK